MRQDIKQKWLAALRSGEYQQGEHLLRNLDNTYCCLGVLTDIAVKEGVGGLEWVEARNRWEVVGGDERIYAVLPPEVSAWAGLCGENPFVHHNGLLTDADEGVSECVIAQLNDQGVSFEKIAEIIEEQL